MFVPGKDDVAKVCGAANDIDMYINALSNQKRHHNIGAACQKLALEFACGDFRDPLRDLDKAAPKTYSQMTDGERAKYEAPAAPRSFLQRTQAVKIENQLTRVAAKDIKQNDKKNTSLTDVKISNNNQNSERIESTSILDISSKIPCYCTILEICDSMAQVPTSGYQQRARDKKSATDEKGV